ncbi:MAG: RIP metalloprotease RseP [Myxococcota bacterium]
MALLDTLVAVIPMLGILIVVHELGHFLVAKACGVRVLKFSIGFGSPIGFGRRRLRWERGGTEYVIGWIPLGGYVRMLGEPMGGEEMGSSAIPDDARSDEYLESKPVWQKLAIVFAGPAMNLLLPILCLMGILWVGLPRADAVIGLVEAESPAAEAGLRVGDRVRSLDGQAIEWWDEIRLPIDGSREGATLRFEIERDGESRRIDVDVALQAGRDRFGAVTDKGWIGLGHHRLAAIVGVPESASMAARIGLRSGDLVLAIDDREVADWQSLALVHEEAAAAARVAGRFHVEWQIERERLPVEANRVTDAPLSASLPAKPIETEKRKFSLPASSNLTRLGLVPATILVAAVSEGKPAALAGLRPRDLILAVDGKPVGSFSSFVSLVQGSAGREMELAYSRDGRVDTLRLRAREEMVAGLYEIEGMEEKVYQIGLAAALSALPGSRSIQQLRNPIASIPRAMSMSWQMTSEFLQGFGKLITGEIGTDRLAGPIGIARIARKSLDRGWLDYLSMMMLISINLGVLNLLPIPILDGGQAMIYAIEGIKRSPLSMRSRERATSIGFGVLALLMGRAFWNDLTPTWMKFMNWLSNSP